ncbi:MAG: cysteine desulfurase [Nitrosomonadaceae bacterium]|nr:cysteine desulfurase [Nitrosomonadaceae bacterium]|tara:strand:+ start:5365 stop:6540 length:1176 start_codon:yes stop_codon:yes gene_type:complete
MNNIKKIYFDHNATTRVDDEVLDAMMPYFQSDFGNPSSGHNLGVTGRQAINQARKQVADSVNVLPSQVIFTSGGSEANNLFIQGAAGYLKNTRIIVSAIEHPCILRPAKEMMQNINNKWDLRQLMVDKSGYIMMNDVDKALTEFPPGIVSVMLANNETGVIQEVAAIAERSRKFNALVHTDAIQAFGKIPVNFPSLNVHAMTLSSHKIYGPKGAAALIIDKELILKPQIYGGGHENGLRSGTENVPAIVGFGKACELSQLRINKSSAQIKKLRIHLEKKLIEMGAIIFGIHMNRLPNTCYFALRNIEGETLVTNLEKAGFAIASGAACSSATPGKSHVLDAMGVEPALARCAVRISLGNSNTFEQINNFIVALNTIVKKLNRISSIMTEEE